MAGPVANLPMETVTPAELRGKITAHHLLLLNVIGTALSPVLVALLTDEVFRDPQQIRWRPRRPRPWRRDRRPRAGLDRANQI